MRLLSLRERDVVPVGKDGLISEEEADGLAALDPLLPRRTIVWQHQAIGFGPFCGVIRSPGLTVELLPKIEFGVRTEKDARGVLVGMLAAAGDLRLSPAGAADLGQQDLHLLDIFILDFCERVRGALRGGPIVRYVEREENLRAVRGRLHLTEHLRLNAFDQSHLLCRFDERSLDNPHNRVLISVIAQLRSRAIGAGARAATTNLLHRFDGVAEVQARASDVEALSFDRMIESWKDVFTEAERLLRGLYPDVRAGQASGSALLFDMERLFEKVLSRRIEQYCAREPGRRLRVTLQGPQRDLAEGAFKLKPDITVSDESGVVAILDAKWKRLDPVKANGGIANGDVYQLNAYADRYGCERLALVYPASATCPPGRVHSFRLKTPIRPILDVVAVDLFGLSRSSEIPVGLMQVFSRREVQFA